MNGSEEFPMTHPVPVTHPVSVTSRAGDTYPSRARSDRRDAQVPERPQFASHQAHSNERVGLRGSHDKQSLLRPEPRLNVTSIFTSNLKGCLNERECGYESPIKYTLPQFRPIPVFPCFAPIPVCLLCLLRLFTPVPVFRIGANPTACRSPKAITC
jgi:hypothetical protein